MKLTLPAAISPPLKWHGGKHYLADQIVGLMPPHVHYVEPYCGGAAVLLKKNPEGISEVINDSNGELTNFWSVLQNPDHFALLQRILAATPFSQVEFDNATEPLACDDPVQRAARFFVQCRQSLSGRMECFASLSRNRVRRGMNEQASAWLTAIDGLPAVHQRLRRVVILNRPAVEVIRSQDGPNTLFYLDPPYPASTRTAREVYGEHEMSHDDHVELLDLIKNVEGKVMISSYHSPLYDEALKDWHPVEFELPNNAASGKEKRRMIECVWCNFEPE